MKRSEIVLKNLQVKNIEKLRKLCNALSVIEEECGIKETKITIDNIWVCEHIDLEALQDTGMEIIVRDLIKKIKGIN